ncbi:MAG: ribulose-phosphate 3-epimerase [Treponema sp.]|jgi:ribulose-phosphate 3-epimerase|nr:ribulose-phosphate 3-epimerase [Treponema sp.]
MNDPGYWHNTPLIYSPSLICLDMCNLESQVRILEDSGIEVLHIDIIDGYFSPSMPLGLETVRAIRKKTKMRFDVHLMANGNDYFIDELLDLDPDQLIFHIETEKHTDAQLVRIKERGIRAGVALKPSTPLAVLDYVLERCDTVMLMLINPGYAGHSGEKQVPYAFRKVTELRRMINDRGLSAKIELDGRISVENIEQYGAGIADIFVIGSTCIPAGNVGPGIRRMNELRKKLLSTERGQGNEYR